MCSTDPGNKVLWTQYINKSLPGSDNYPVRVVVKLDAFPNCSEERECDDNLKLHIVKYNGNSQKGFTLYPILPDSRTLVQDAIQYYFHFDLNEAEDSFALQLINFPNHACVTVSRVLVYRHECPQLSIGLERRPATQAPVNGAVSAMPYCVANSHHSELSRPRCLMCTSEGEWMNDRTDCVCDRGYYEDGTICKSMCLKVKKILFIFSL